MKKREVRKGKMDMETVGPTPQDLQTQLHCQSWYQKVIGSLWVLLCSVTGKILSKISQVSPLNNYSSPTKALLSFFCDPLKDDLTLITAKYSISQYLVCCDLLPQFGIRDICCFATNQWLFWRLTPLFLLNEQLQIKRPCLSSVIHMELPLASMGIAHIYPRAEFVPRTNGYKFRKS